MWKYRKLSFEEAELINGMNPSQYIKNAWREVAGKRQLVEINYYDKDWPNGYDYHLSHLTIAFYGAMGCREAAEVNRTLLGNDPRDVQLEFVL
ncbi:hypothetical protein [Paenibacillus favisporus]|uniref:hypothetical protein n=1 Tax=Paenibacillus favisporus TaxID=221028 RepID=UPI0013D07D96|nr:hypothetical protein [Paenibacillus favisporus]